MADVRRKEVSLGYYRIRCVNVGRNERPFTREPGTGMAVPDHRRRRIAVACPCGVRAATSTSGRATAARPLLLTGQTVNNALDRARLSHTAGIVCSMVEIAAHAFLSYAHEDNEREGGRILRLAKFIENEFQTLTGTKISIFTDKAEIKWGQDFRAQLDEALQETTFFIPILTPTYFLRDECRKEMSQFVSSAKALGLEELLLSIRYIPVLDMLEGSADEWKDVAARMQYEPWENLRLDEEDSSTYRRGVNRLALRLIELTRELEAKPVVAPTSASQEGASSPRTKPTTTATAGNEEDTADDDAPGPLDLVADLQPAIEEWGTTLTAITPATARFNGVVTAASERMSAANLAPSSFAAKVVVARQLAQELEGPLADIESLSKEYSTKLLRLDPGMRALLGMIVESDEDAEDIKKFIESIQGMVEGALTAASSIREAADSAQTVGKLSRDIRPAFRRYETAMRNVADGSALIEGWQPLLDEIRSRFKLTEAR